MESYDFAILERLFQKDECKPDSDTNNRNGLSTFDPHIAPTAIQNESFRGEATLKRISETYKSPIEDNDEIFILIIEPGVEGLTVSGPETLPDLFPDLIEEPLGKIRNQNETAKIVNIDGVSKIYANGYILDFDSQKGDNYYWKCGKSTKGCRGRASTQIVCGEVLLKMVTNHNHIKPEYAWEKNRGRMLSQSTNSPNCELIISDFKRPEICKTIESRRWNRVLHARGYTMVREKRRYNIFSWICDKKRTLGCKGRAVTKCLNLKHILKRFTVHNHEATANTATMKTIENKKEIVPWTDKNSSKIEICHTVEKKKYIRKLIARGYIMDRENYRGNRYHWTCHYRKSIKCKGRATTTFIDGQHHLIKFTDHIHNPKSKVVTVEPPKEVAPKDDVEEIWETIQTMAGNPKLIARGYLLNKEKNRKNIYNWICGKSKSIGCKGRAITELIDGKHHKRKFINHSHPVVENTVIIAKFLLEVKKQARTTLRTPCQIIGDVFSRVNEDKMTYMPSKEAVLKMIRRERRKLSLEVDVSEYKKESVEIAT